MAAAALRRRADRNQPSALDIDDLDAPLIGAFLDHLEHERHNSVRTREITTESPDFGHLEPMVRATQRELAALGLGDPGVVLADAGYWHQRQMQQIAGEGIALLVPPDAGLRRGERPGWTGGMYSFMRHVLATAHGYELYRQRQITIEPVFARLSSTARSNASNAAAEPRVAANGG